jgi:hypothetical protein
MPKIRVVGQFEGYGLVGRGFSPDINTAISKGALAPEGIFFKLTHCQKIAVFRRSPLALNPDAWNFARDQDRVASVNNQNIQIVIIKSARHPEKDGGR